MTEYDPSQERALSLDMGRHARVLGAPGSGKTRVLVEAFARAVERPDWDENDVLVLAPNRLVSAQLRAAVEHRVGRAMGGTPVRTAASLGFALLSRVTALAGDTAPRLLTGTVQDEAIAAVVSAREAAGISSQSGLTAEVTASATYRAELRELWRVTDDFSVPAQQLVDELNGLRSQTVTEVHTRLPSPDMIDRWVQSLEIVAEVGVKLANERPDELSASAVLRAAASAVHQEGFVGQPMGRDAAGVQIPRLILVDDAQELGEGELALLAGCARAGSSIWVFGDPDLATGAFNGERARVMTRLHEELARRGAFATRPLPEQVAVLEKVYRHGTELRGFLRDLTSRIGASDAAEHRSATAAEHAQAADCAVQPLTAQFPAVQFAKTASPAEQLGVIAHRFRARKLGLGGSDPVAWSEMAVVCRTRAEANRVARMLAVHQVPTKIAAGGLVLREHQIVRELIRLLQHVLGILPLGAADILGLAGGVIGGLDPVGIRRLRGALLTQTRRDARDHGRDAEPIDVIVAEAFAAPGPIPIVDSAGGRVLRRLGMIGAAAEKVRESGGTAREVLWSLWEGTQLADRWQSDALDGRSARAEEADRSLDAVLGLFFALQRHEEQDSEQPIGELLADLLESTVPEDSLARRSERGVVTVTTPQGAMGCEFDVVAMIGAQDGSWPNLRARGSLLGATSLERWLRGGEAVAPSRRDTIHDELRLFVHSCARARTELLVVAISDEDHHPSAFFRFGQSFLCEGLPSARLTLRGATGDLRRRFTSNPQDGAALQSLIALAAEQAEGAHPDEWYGVLPASCSEPLVDIDGDPEALVSVSPSQLERAEECPLDWVIASLGGGTGSVQASLGTLVHHAFETVHDIDRDAMLDSVMSQWHKLPFDAEWESARAHRLAAAMTDGLVDYLRDFAGSGRELLGRETAFRIPIERAVLRGTADRLEYRIASDGAVEVTVVDLKTGRTPPSTAKIAEHAQLQAYQLGVATGAFATSASQARSDAADVRSGGARLLFVHPDATKGGGYIERAQEPISRASREALVQRVSRIARVMAAREFTARVEHHCSDPHKPGNCRVHIIPAVSYA